MSAAHQATSQQAPTAWTEPPWSGWIETTGDALLILEAARRGLIPRVTRRLVDAERKMITSGSVFVFDEDESGIKRWTDGLFWSPSRILGNFLLYRETDKRGNRNARAEPDDSDALRPDGTLSRPKTEVTGVGIDKHRERTLLGSLTNSYKFKPDGLMKKTFSLTIGGVAQHLISYYKIEDVENGRLRSPSSLPELASLEISAEYLDKTHFRNPPKVEAGHDGVLRYRGEGDELDSPSSSNPNQPAPSLLLDNPHKRPKRSAPYQSRPPKKKTKHPDPSIASSSATPAPTPEATSGAIVLSTPQSSTSSIPPAPPAQLYSPDPNTTQAPPSSYPSQYPYFPPHPPPTYPPHVNPPMYPQPSYPPPVAQPAPGVMNPQHVVTQYYPNYPPTIAPAGQPPQVSPVHDSSRSPTTVSYYYPPPPPQSHPSYGPYNPGPPAAGWPYPGPPAHGYPSHQPPPPLPQVSQRAPAPSGSTAAITPTTEQK
ncbi:hypothetical protein EST38_g13345 [Candolleomyces aberdarensis]|uniref:cAMP-independent regulatory protein n=1 Tax=Candolleomyces aberdarensis TaxID=2316362 RepID=A0A4Q2D070_9AGAR|nr:hypothetical protein EST38_g13345 [Candolleomyces aberdarensis]